MEIVYAAMVLITHTKCLHDVLFIDSTDWSLSVPISHVVKPTGSDALGVGARVSYAKRE